MIAQHFAVVRAEDQQAVLQVAARVQRVQHLSQLLVHRRDFGVVVPPHACDVFLCGQAQIDLCLAGGVRKPLLMFQVLRRFLLQFAFPEYCRRHVSVPVEIQVPGQRVPRFVRAGEADLQEERAGAAVVLNPGYRRAPDIDVTVILLFVMPGHSLEFFQPVRVRDLTVVGARQAVEAEIAAPVVVRAAACVGFVGGVFHHDPLVEPAGHVARAEVHFADVHAPVAGLGQILHPVPVVGPVVKAVDAGAMGVHAGEHGGA